MKYQAYKNNILSYLDSFSWFQKLSFLVFLYPLFSQKAQVLLIGLWALSSIIFSYQNKTYLEFSIKKLKIVVFLSIIYLVYILDFFLISTTRDVLSGYLETGALLIVFPLLLLLNSKVYNKSFITVALWVYVFSISVLNFITFFNIANEGLLELIKKDSFYNPVFRSIYAKESGIHLPYLGLMYQFACLIILNSILKRNNRLTKSIIILLLINILLLNIATFLFSARMALIASFVAFVYLLFTIEKNKKRKAIYIITALFFIITLSFMPPIKRRIDEAFNTKWEMPNKSYIGKNKEVNFRYVIYSCSFNILQNNWITGIGLGNVQKELNKCYQTIDYQGYDDFNSKKYNTHNQYLLVFIAYGVVGLIGFLFFVLNGWKNGNALYRSFIILMFLSFLTENILYRQAGVVFFSLFNSILYLNKENKVI